MIVLRMLPFLFESTYIGYVFILMVVSALIFLLVRR